MKILTDKTLDWRVTFSTYSYGCLLSSILFCKFWFSEYNSAEGANYNYMRIITWWFHCYDAWESHSLGRSADMAFHFPQSQSWWFLHLGSEVPLVTDAQQSRHQTNLPARWWWSWVDPCRTTQNIYIIFTFTPFCIFWSFLYFACCAKIANTMLECCRWLPRCC